jgi:NAD(P)H-hydrate repair Nnr-like enzyme with NAD(P)H-hydrate epimerase domain
MRQIDAKAVILGLPIFLMMENAGNTLARYMLKGLDIDLRGKKITVLCGLSNNGGGGFASARHLAYYAAIVSVFILGKREDIRKNNAMLQ